MPSKKDYKRAYFALRLEVQRLKEARLADVHAIARSHDNHRTPGFKDWGEYAAQMPFRTGSEVRSLIGRARDIDRELVDDDED